jgi:periplasmic protein TonB
MSENSNIQGLFDVSGNLTVRAMERYFSGKLSQDERAIVEKHLDINPFDRDALEGLRKHYSAQSLTDIEELKEAVILVAGRSSKEVISRSHSRTYWFAAASVVLLTALSVFLVMLIRSPLEKPQLAVTQPDTINSTASPVMQEDQNQSVSEDDIIPVPPPPVTRINIVEDDESATGQELAEEPVVVVNDEVIVDADIISESKMALGNEAEMADSTSIFMVVEQMPEFPGGEDSLYSFIARHIRYPQAAKESGIQGRVFVTFVVEKDGSVSDARILRGIGGGCDEEALRMVQAMPKWLPGKQRGKPIRVQYNMPIKFSLE